MNRVSETQLEKGKKMVGRLTGYLVGWLAIWLVVLVSVS